MLLERGFALNSRHRIVVAADIESERLCKDLGRWRTWPRRCCCHRWRLGYKHTQLTVTEKLLTWCSRRRFCCGLLWLSRQGLFKHSIQLVPTWLPIIVCTKISARVPCHQHHVRHILRWSRATSAFWEAVHRRSWSYASRIELVRRDTA